ncbi:hypothetical protein, partial [Nocardia sp. NPDC059229]|uniref:hypothetical protein n=1 Tax=Nocardia sp. NPDC059229 TaxID=3346778 RepID=UPI0036B96FA1
FEGWCATFHDTIDPVPVEGTQSRVVARHDEQALVIGATNVAQSVQCLIIRVVPRWCRGFSGLWSNIGILASSCLRCH